MKKTITKTTPHIYHSWSSNRIENICNIYDKRCLSNSQQLSDFTITFHFHALEKEMATHSSILAIWQMRKLKHRYVKITSAAAAAKSLQLCPTLCDPIDGSPPGSPFPGILQARTLEWVAISFSKAWKGKVKVKSLSRIRLLGTPWTAAYQAPPSMGFSRQEYWSGCHCLLQNNF